MLTTVDSQLLEDLMPPRSKTFGAAIRNARDKRGLTQGELGDLLGKRQTTISQWELGDSRPRVTDIPRIAEVLHVPADWLLKLHLGMPEPKDVEALDDHVERLEGLVLQVVEELAELRRRIGG